jgi:hypothetical protein
MALLTELENIFIFVIPGLQRRQLLTELEVIVIPVRQRFRFQRTSDILEVRWHIAPPLVVGVS